MQYSVEQVISHLGELVLSVSDADATFSSIDSDRDYAQDSLIFMSEEPQKNGDEQTIAPAVIVTSANIAKQLSTSSSCIISVSNVRLALAFCKQKFADYDAADSEWGDIHPTALIHPTATLGNGVRVGPNSVIGKGAQIGDNVRIRTNCVIEHGAVIGRDTTLHHGACVGYDCVVGERVILRPGVVVGNEGFGFAQDEHRRYHRIPHTGVVRIDDDVQIGTHSNIDRGTFGVTHISRGVKMDSLCHIAHNVSVGEDVLFVSQCGIAGSTVIGDRAILSGQTGVLDHKTISPDAVLVHRCGVTTDIPEPGMWAGTPPKPFKEYVKEISLAKKVAKLEKKIKDLERQG